MLYKFFIIFLFCVTVNGCRLESPQGNHAMERATFGAGCFWGVEAAFGKVDGVTATQVGYAGGSFKNPTYEDVCSGKTGHAEVVDIQYDPAKVSYAELLRTFWKIHNPCTPNRQGPDIGSQYRSLILFHNAEQEAAAKDAMAYLEKTGSFDKSVVTLIEPFKAFYRAEEYHQQYYKKCKGGICPVP